MCQQIILWLDDERDPKKFRKISSNSWRYNEKVIWCHSVNEAIDVWLDLDGVNDCRIVEVDLDHDAGEFATDGGDYIKFLDWLEEHKIDFTKIAWKIHSFNPVGIKNMLAILHRNGVI